MADILIRGMEMPASCVGCILTYDDGQDICCVFTGVPCLGIGRQDACPLIQLPEGHGKLGDLDALMNNIGNVPYKGSVRRVLMSAPTIVPAEGGIEENE